MKTSIIDFTEAYNYYKNGNSITKTESVFKKRRCSLKKEWLKLGYEYPLFQRKGGYSTNCPAKLNFDLNVNFFKNIDTETKAYFLGLIAADGTIVESVSKSKKNTKKYFALSFKKSDEDILHYFKKCINSYSDVKYSYKLPFLGKNNNIYTPELQSYFRVYRKDFINNLLNKGIVPNKTKIGIVLPDLPDDLIPHFIRGYFDGDGCIGIYPYKHNDKFNTICYICSNTLEILNSFFNYLKNRNIDCFIIHSKQGMYYLRIRRKSILEFWNIIKPKDDYNASLKRKFEKFKFLQEL